MKIIYWIDEDGIYSTIRKREVDATEKVDNQYHYFDSLNKAKKSLLDNLRSRRDDYRNAIKDVAQISEMSLEEND